MAGLVWAILLVAGAAAHEHTGLAVPDTDKIFISFHEEPPKIYDHKWNDGTHFEEYGYHLDFKKGRFEKFHGYYNASLPDMPYLLMEHTTEKVADMTYKCDTTFVCGNDKYVMTSMKKMEVSADDTIFIYTMNGALTMPDGMVYEVSGKVVDDSGAYTVDMSMPSMTNPKDTATMNLAGVSFYHPSSPHVLNLTIQSPDSFISYQAVSYLHDNDKPNTYGAAGLQMKCITMPEITANLRIDKNEEIGMDIRVDAMVGGKYYSMFTEIMDESVGNSMIKKVKSNMNYQDMVAPCNMMCTLSLSPDNKSIEFDYNGEYGTFNMSGSQSLDGNGKMLIDLTSPSIKSTLNMDANIVAKQMATKFYLQENGSPMINSEINCNMIDEQSGKCSMESDMKGEKYMGSIEGIVEPQNGGVIRRLNGNIILPNVQRPLLGELVMSENPGKSATEFKVNNNIMFMQNVEMSDNGIYYMMKSPLCNAILKIGAFTTKLVEVFDLKLDSVWVPQLSVKMEHERDESGMNRHMLFNIDSDALPPVDMHATCKMTDLENGEVKMWGTIAGNDYRMSLDKSLDIVPGESTNTINMNVELPNLMPMSSKMVVKDNNGNYTVDITSNLLENDNDMIKLTYYNYETTCIAYLDSNMMQANMTSDMGLGKTENSAMMHLNSRWTPPITLKIDLSTPTRGNGGLITVLDIGGREFALSGDMKSEMSNGEISTLISTELTAPGKKTEMGLFKFLMFKGGYSGHAEMTKYWIYPAVRAFSEKIDQKIKKIMIPIELHIHSMGKKMMEKMERLG